MAGEQARGGGRPRSPRPVRAKWAGGQAAAATAAAAVRPPTHTHTHVHAHSHVDEEDGRMGRTIYIKLIFDEA